MITFLILYWSTLSFFAGGIFTAKIIKRRLKEPIDNEKTPYDCYWSRRALAAEKELKKHGLL